MPDNTNSLAAFLFQGAPPTQTSTSAQYGPQWLQQALAGTVGAASQLASQPYQPYQGPLVATPSQQTQQAWNMAGQNVGNYQPFLKQAGALTQSAAAPITSNDVSAFLNPYQDYVTGALTRNFNENVLPNIQDKFVSAGQSRSPQEAEITGRATRDLNTSIGQSLAGGYQGALSSLLQQRGQMGQLGAQEGQLGALSSQLGAQDVAQQSAAGQAQDVLSQANLNAAYGQFQQQQQWPYQQLGFLSNTIRGLPLQAAGTTTQSSGTYYPQQNAGITNSLGGASALSGMGYRKGGAVRRAGPLTSVLRSVA